MVHLACMGYSCSPDQSKRLLGTAHLRDWCHWYPIPTSRNREIEPRVLKARMGRLCTPIRVLPFTKPQSTEEETEARRRGPRWHPVYARAFLSITTKFSVASVQNSFSFFFFFVVPFYKAVVRQVLGQHARYTVTAFLLQGALTYASLATVLFSQGCTVPM